MAGRGAQDAGRRAPCLRVAVQQLRQPHQHHPLHADHPAVPGRQGLSLLERAGQALPSFADRPAFIGWGLRDFVFDHHFLAGFQAALPQAQVHAFEDAGHYVLEDKHEVLVPKIRAFLDANPL